MSTYSELLAEDEPPPQKLPEVPQLYPPAPKPLLTDEQRDEIDKLLD